ncbi:MAG: hypothetical protein AB7S70_10495 [Hyphomicrobium sp.]
MRMILVALMLMAGGAGVTPALADDDRREAMEEAMEQKQEQAEKAAKMEMKAAKMKAKAAKEKMDELD